MLSHSAVSRSVVHGLSAFRSFSRWRWSVYKAFHLDAKSAEFQKAVAICAMKPHGTLPLREHVPKSCQPDSTQGSKRLMINSATKANNRANGNQQAA